MEADEGSDQKSDIQPHWMTAHARLKNEFTEYQKYYNLMRWLIDFFSGKQMTLLELVQIFVKEWGHIELILKMFPKGELSKWLMN